MAWSPSSRRWLHHCQRCFSLERGVELLGEVWCELEKRGHQIGIEAGATTALDLCQHVLHPPRLLVGPLGEKGVIHVHHSADAPHERNLLALPTGRVAAAVPVLVMAAGDALRHLHEGVGRPGEDLRTESRVRLDGLPLLGVELTGLQQDPIGYADLADVVHDARVPERLGLRWAPADVKGEAPPQHAASGLAVLAVVVHAARVPERLGLRWPPADVKGETLAQHADAMDVLARLRLARLDGRSEERRVGE